MYLFTMNSPALSSEYEPFFESLPFQGDQRKSPQNKEVSEIYISDIDI